MLTSCSREESKAASRGTFRHHSPDTAQLDQWFPLGQFAPTAPLSPPDSVSTCTFVDLDDMWSQDFDSNPEWMADQALPDDRLEMHPSENTWSLFGSAVPSVHMIEPTSWLDGQSGSVEFGVSPVLSYDESNNSRSLTSLPAPDVSSAPRGLDLSFVDPNWRMSGSSVVVGPFQEANNVGATDSDTRGLSSDLLCDTWASTAAGFSPHTVVSVPEAEVDKDHHFYGKATLEIPHGQTCDSVVGGYTGMASPPRHPVLVPGILGWTATTGTPPNVPSVQTAGPLVDEAISLTQPFDLTPPAMVTTTSNGLRRHSGEVRPVSTFGRGEISRGFEPSQTGARPVQVASPISPSQLYPLPGEVQSASSSRVPVGALPYTAHLNLRNEHISGHENDEGRHRTDPLYAKGPQPDGLYHCPYAEETNCQHKPTKLKCNYDKFIDSHLKPFRCKHHGCSKLAFSSTACLLRHEREAHGMHGHGERPHLCRFPGCERSNPGNGFPRRYNLYDHMKRVHQFRAVKESDRVADDDRKGSGSRKRKESASTVPDSPVKMMKMDTGLVSPPLMQADIAHVHHGSEYGRRSQHEQNRIYSQWESQRELLARQLGSVQSPDDEANLERLSRNIAELRRLSEEARSI